MFEDCAERAEPQMPQMAQMKTWPEFIVSYGDESHLPSRAIHLRRFSRHTRGFAALPVEPFSSPFVAICVICEIRGSTFSA